MRQRKLQLLSILLALVLFAGLCPVLGTTASAEEPKDLWTDNGNYNIGWYTGNGPYEISNAAELAGLAAIVNGTASGITETGFSGKTINLTADIDLSAHEWVPMNGFAGTFDGQGHVISEMKVD